MNGSIHQDKRSGKYCIKLYLEGKQVCICTDKHTGGSFSSKAHAVKVLGVIQSEIDAGAFSRDEWRQGAVSPKITVKWYASIWLENLKKMVEKGLLVPSTVIDNTTNVKRYILPRFARRALGSITAKDILEFKGSISRSPAGVSNVLGTFQKMLNSTLSDCSSN